MMIWITKGKIRKLIDVDRVERAIAAAEQKTSGEIRISIAPWFWGSVDRAADAAFVRLGMTQTAERNGVLFFLVPSRHTFVVRGDSAIHQHVGQAFWDQLATTMSAYFRRREFTEGLLWAIGAAADRLASHFPGRHESDVDELPNDIDIP
jgi:uncharacterized membrane protein